MDKEFQEKLKEDVHLKVSDSDDAQATVASSNTKTPTGQNQSKTNTSVLTNIEQPVDKASSVAEKKLREKAFLDAHNKRLVRSRVWFGSIFFAAYLLLQALVLYAFGTGSEFNTSFSKLIPITMFGSIGEKDFAYSQISQITNNGVVKTPEAADARTKIIDNAIASLTSKDNPAILTRLSAEEAQMKIGDRAKGLQYGDALIAKYPTLASNYLWRAKVDFEQAFFDDVIKEDNQAIDLLNKGSAENARAWNPELSKGYWASLYSGHFDQASIFTDHMAKFGADPGDIQGMKSLRLIAFAESLGVPSLKNTDLYTPEVAKTYKASLERAIAIASKMPAYPNYYDEIDELGSLEKSFVMERATLALGQYDYMKDSLDQVHYYREDLRWAQFYLAQGNAREALKLVNGYRFKHDHFDRLYAKADALQQLHRSKDAIAAATTGLELFNKWDMTTLNYLPLRLIKAHALADSHQFQQALDECSLILKINPNMIEAHVIKMQVYKEMGQTTDADKEHQIIKEGLQKAIDDSKRMLAQ